MRDFVAMVFEFNTGEPDSSATLWLHVSDDDLLRTHIPIDMEDAFTPIGPLPYEAAERAAAFLKETLAHFGVECVEHTASDD